ncbi:fluoride efflux transporter FluC [Cohnella lupini]|uniref:Fluoride-specific ion channel FluC n=1 Tax=Cohnella lupini TaxID=1294267 RepID=A0A3D9IXP4_9BACL|nr:CrcB family protein [Cohnella lupini]RED65866.1 camphor resistance protein CrcB [Cohnella lupini]
MKSIWLAGLVGVGGSIGALMRYGISRATVASRKPAYYGTLLVNLAGSFAIGMFIGFELESEHVAEYAFYGIGILGGLTTYSTLNVQKVTMLRQERGRVLVYYLAATYVGGFGLTAAGAGLGYLLHT